MTVSTSLGRAGGKVALVTGGASGIGRAVARLLAREGARVAVADIDADGAALVAGEIRDQGREALSMSLDVASESDWQSVVGRILETWQRLDMLVNSAGISFAASVSDMTLADWRRVMAVNSDSVFLGVKHAAPAMRTSGGGSIVVVSSASGVKAGAGASAYCTSKAATRMFSKVAALELASDNIRVNTVSPGGVATPMWESMPFFQELAARTGGREKAFAALSQDVPLKRFAEPEEIALAVLYLASDESRFVTGADLVVDGGYTA